MSAGATAERKFFFIPALSERRESQLRRKEVPLVGSEVDEEWRRHWAEMTQQGAGIITRRPPTRPGPASGDGDVATPEAPDKPTDLDKPSWRGVLKRTGSSGRTTSPTGRRR